MQVDARIYLNNGATFNGYNPPQSVLYDSGFFAIKPNLRSTLIFARGDRLPAGGVNLTSQDTTRTVTFEGMGTSDSVGLDLYWPPAVGSTYGDLWQNAGDGWTLQTFENSTAFAAVMETPEPSSLSLSLLGGVATLLAVYRSRRKE